MQVISWSVGSACCRLRGWGKLRWVLGEVFSGRWDLYELICRSDVYDSCPPFYYEAFGADGELIVRFEMGEDGEVLHSPTSPEWEGKLPWLGLEAKGG